MGLWLVDADVLARSRFVLSPLVETVAALGVLSDERPEPWQRPWLAGHLPAYRRRLAGDAFARAWVESVLRSRWMPDFVGMPPCLGEVTFEQELGRLRATPPEAARADVAISCGGTLPAELDRPDLAPMIADLLEWVWEQCVRADWPRRARIFEADVVSRIHRLGQQGWASAIEELIPNLRWLGDGRLRINLSDRPTRELSGAELLFIPSSARRGWVAFDLPARYAVIYPASGLLAEPGPAAAAPTALARLLGASRAEILARTDPPRSTSQLAALTGLGLGTVGDHLKVLLEARLVDRRRSGPSVLYYRTALADQLVAAQEPGRCEPGATAPGSSPSVR
ncbi:winged helix-turn-helix domain-containing protein [Kitasatospora sp. MAP5-34]|uniref:winged helix-turn-helix domain-containing protein n=1 Tax=Kitasatospora sp. MAP5-34 TaxID=3035102 RepID=UPI00247478C7|nr:winged helix-turn-helix domain-containing protein [Kitasatospora sp. MAP5-34]MDH6580008.1 DNA-binding transcriptional ArsR family regulator [Kitasatospora sp. MAP5-34]